MLEHHHVLLERRNHARAATIVARAELSARFTDLLFTARAAHLLRRPERAVTQNSCACQFVTLDIEFHYTF